MLNFSLQVKLTEKSLNLGDFSTIFKIIFLNIQHNKLIQYSIKLIFSGIYSPFVNIC